MNYIKEEVIQYIMEDDVKFIRLAFCDVFGKQRNISIILFFKVNITWEINGMELLKYIILIKY